jgi:hypothetical protein
VTGARQGLGLLPLRSMLLDSTQRTVLREEISNPLDRGISMPVELIHFAIGCIFLAVWLMVGQIVVSDR